jgi:hypothetical protein
MSYRFIVFFQFPLLLIYFTFFNENISAQNNIGIGTTTPNTKAIFDIFSTDKGFLLPRMTTLQRIAINPAGNTEAGLLVYDTNDNLYYYWNGTQWIPFPQTGASSFNISLNFDNASRVLSLTDAGGTLITNITDSDNQTLSLTGQTLSISNGNSITLPAATDNQTLSIAGNVISISNGNNITIPNLIDTDAQTLALNGNTLSISNGNSITLPNFINTDEQTLSLNGNTLSILNGNSVTLPTDNDPDPTNELQTLTMNKVGSTINWNLSNNGGNGSFSLQDDDWSGAGSGSMYPTTITDNVAVGTNNATEKLTVQGNMLLNGALKGSVRYYTSRNTASGTITANNTDYLTLTGVTPGATAGVYFVTFSWCGTDRVTALGATDVMSVDYSGDAGAGNTLLTDQSFPKSYLTNDRMICNTYVCQVNVPANQTWTFKIKIQGGTHRSELFNGFISAIRVD